MAFFMHHLPLCSANLRAAVNPEWVNKIEVPYTNALKTGKVVQGEVATITKDTVQLTDGRTFPFDYVIVGKLFDYQMHMYLHVRARMRVLCVCVRVCV